MRKVTIFQLQRNPSRELESLPFKVTRYGKTVAVVNGFNVTSPENKTPPPVKIIENIKKDPIQKLAQKSGRWICEHEQPGFLCRFQKCRDLARKKDK